MSSEITGSGPQLSDESIASFEERVGRKIPTEYREFLLQHNGGYPDPSDFVINGRDNVPDLMGTVEQFLGIGVGDEYAEVERYLTQFKDRMPSDFFPIAQDPGGNIILIGAEGDIAGEIFFWDHEEESEEGDSPTRRNIYPVAGSLTELLRNLQ